MCYNSSSCESSACFGKCSEHLNVDIRLSVDQFWVSKIPYWSPPYQGLSSQPTFSRCSPSWHQIPCWQSNIEQRRCELRDRVCQLGLPLCFMGSFKALRRQGSCYHRPCRWWPCITLEPSCAPNSHTMVRSRQLSTDSMMHWQLKPHLSHLLRQDLVLTKYHGHVQTSGMLYWSLLTCCTFKIS